jgi:hypothetical protein
MVTECDKEIEIEIEIEKEFEKRDGVPHGCD